MGPVRRYILGPAIKYGAMARAVVIGSLWPQRRLYDSGYVNSPVCQACDMTDGTLWHRHVECPMYEYLRIGVPEDVKRAWSSHCFATRGILPYKNVIEGAPCVAPPIVKWLYEYEFAWFSGSIFTDGSGRMLKDVMELCRCGWGAAFLRDLKLHAGCWGNLPGDIQTAPRAELYAIWFVLHRGTTPLFIYTDHDNHVKAIRDGKAHCLRWNAPHLDLWKKIWVEIDRLGEYLMFLRCLGLRGTLR